jgi:hypothetical protein
MKYILDDEGNAVLCNDTLKWGKWMEANQQSFKRILSRTTIQSNPHIFVSTVFLGIDHNYCSPDYPMPILWETMVFGGKLDGEQDRYTSKEDAVAGHLKFVDEQRKLLND